MAAARAPRRRPSPRFGAAPRRRRAPWRPRRPRCARSGSSSRRGSLAPGSGSAGRVRRRRRWRRCWRCGRGRGALDLEQIGEVRCAEEPQLAADRLRRGVEDLDLLEDAAAHEPQATHGHAVGAEARCLGIRQEEGGGVVVDCRRLEQREGPSVEPELPPAHEAGVLVHETSDRAGRHVAARVREHERPPLQDRDRVGAQLGGGRSLVPHRRGRPGLRIRVERRRAPLDRRRLAAGASVRAHGGKTRTAAGPAERVRTEL